MHRLPSQLIVPSLLLSLTSLSACAVHGSGTIETIEPLLDPGAVTGIELNSGLEAIVTRGARAHVSITGDDNLLAEMVVRRAGATLSIGFPDSVGGYRPTQPIQVEATLPEVERFVSSGGGQLSLEGEFEGDHFEFELSGGGTVEVDSMAGKSISIELSGGSRARFSAIDVDSVGIDSSGGGYAELHGKTGTLEAHFSGDGTLEAIACEAEAVSLELSGGSDARVHATELLDVDVSGGGTVVYRGEPETIEKELSGRSELKPE